MNRRGFVGEEIGGAADEAGPAGVGRAADRPRRGRQVVPSGEDSLDGAVVRAVVRQGPLAGHLEPLGAVLGLQVQHPLGGPQALGDAVREEPLDQPGTGRPDPDGLLQTPGAVMGEEGPGLGRQMIGDGAPLAGPAATGMDGHRLEVLIHRHHAVGGAQPQALAHQREGHRVEPALEAHVAVPMHRHLLPAAQIRRHRRQGQEQRALHREALQRPHPRRAVDALPGHLQDPRAHLGVEIRQIAEGAGRQEVALHVLHARFDDALLLRVPRRAGVDPEAVALRALGVGPLHLGVAGAGAGDGALGVVDDQPRRHRAEPLEGPLVAAEPGAHALVPHELHVLVAREGEGHHEGPGAAKLAGGGVDELRAGAEVHLGRVPRLEGQAHRGVGRQLAPDGADQAADAGVMAGEAVLAHQGGVDRHAGDALAEPALDEGAVGTEGRLGRGRQARGRQRGGDLGVRRQGAAGLKPALRVGQRAKAGRLGAAHQTGAGNLALRIALTQTHQGLAVLVHLDTPAGHRLPPAKPGRVAVSRERSRRPSE